MSVCKIKVVAHAIATRSSRHTWPLSLWWKLIRYTETQGHCDIRFSTVYLPQVFLGTHVCRM